MVELIILLVGLIVIFSAILIGYNAIKKRRLEIKLNEYQILLENARKSRLAYVSTLNSTEKAKFLVETAENEATSVKTRLIENKVELWKMLAELRNNRAANITSNFDQKVLEKKISDFRHSWKSSDLLKTHFNQKYAEVKALRDQCSKISQASDGKSEQWFELRRKVMDMYAQLRRETPLANPREVLLKDDAP